VPRANDAINETWIADRDRYSCEGLYSDDRAGKPMVKEGGTWREVDWETALEAAAAGLHRGLEGAEFVDAQGGGVLIRSVAEGSPAAQRGLRANDIIIGVGRTRIANLAEFQRATEGAAAFVLQIRRGNAMLVIPIG